MNTTPKNLITEKFKSKNILINPGANGIGDFLQVLAAGLIIFNGKHFDLISARGGYPQRYMPHYEDYFFKIVDAYTLCNKLHLMEHLNYNEAEHLKDVFNKEGYHAHLIKSKFEIIDGRKICSENIKTISQNFNQNFDFSKKTTKENSFVKSDKKLKICVSLRYYNSIYENHNMTIQKHLLKKREINSVYKAGTSTDIVKWQEYILWIQKKYDCQLFLIGERDKDSPYYISKDKLYLIRSNPDIVVLFHKETDIRDDLHTLQNCDAVLGGLGTMIWIAMLFGKPLIAFDLPVIPITKIPVYYNVNSVHQIYTETNLSEMKKITDCFFINIIDTFKKNGIIEVFNTHDQKIFQCIKDLINDGFSFDQLPSWHNYNEAYFVLSKLFLKFGNYKKAEELLEKIDDSIYMNEKELYYIGRELKDKKRFQYATKILLKSVMWAEAFNEKSFLSASYFHLGEISYTIKDFDEALFFFSECLRHLSSHIQARNYVLKILKKLKKTIVYCDLSPMDIEILDKNRFKLLKFENILSKNEYLKVINEHSNLIFLCSIEAQKLILKNLKKYNQGKIIVLNSKFLKILEQVI